MRPGERAGPWRRHGFSDGQAAAKPWSAGGRGTAGCIAHGLGGPAGAGDPEPPRGPRHLAVWNLTDPRGSLPAHGHAGPSRWSRRLHRSRAELLQLGVGTAAHCRWRAHPHQPSPRVHPWGGSSCPLAPTLSRRRSEDAASCPRQSLVKIWLCPVKTTPSPLPLGRAVRYQWGQVIKAARPAAERRPK